MVQALTVASGEAYAISRFIQGATDALREMVDAIGVGPLKISTSLVVTGGLIESWGSELGGEVLRLVEYWDGVRGRPFQRAHP